MQRSPGVVVQEALVVEVKQLGAQLDLGVR